MVVKTICSHPLMYKRVASGTPITYYTASKGQTLSDNLSELTFK
jgi:hypothetical protein